MSKKRIFSEQEINKMIEMYLEGQTYSNIAKEIKTKSSKVSSYLKSLGYGLRPKNTLINHEYLSNSRKHCVDEDYFSEINTENKAYWLGFLFADGYIKKDMTSLVKKRAAVLNYVCKSKMNIIFIIFCMILNQLPQLKIK